MKPIYIFRHLANEGPGYFTDYLHARGLPSRVIAIDAGDGLPADVGGAAALVFMGGSMSVNDPLPWIADELRLIRQAHAIGMPVLGHCLGGQLIAKALGAEVRANAVKEIGWHDVEKISEDTPWLSGLPSRFEVFHWHGETFELPAGAVPLLRSAWCEQQAFAVGRMLALQCHVEMTAEMVLDWADVGKSELSAPSPSVQSYGALSERLPERTAALHRVADVMYGYWLAQVTTFNAGR